ncbi:MAG: hypothetical protein AUH07_05225 [Gemmatimonadetes bacterium 13_2_20CM_70_9]|nr:MAG: hypothetical protein AUH07_05225 [Gemmatimonadetes bacterium 13_2_20CM_70_9]
MPLVRDTVPAIRASTALATNVTGEPRAFAALAVTVWLLVPTVLPTVSVVLRPRHAQPGNRLPRSIDGLHHERGSEGRADATRLGVAGDGCEDDDRRGRGLVATGEGDGDRGE